MIRKIDFNICFLVIAWWLLPSCVLHYVQENQSRLLVLNNSDSWVTGFYLIPLDSSRSRAWTITEDSLAPGSSSKNRNLSIFGPIKLALKVGSDTISISTKLEIGESYQLSLEGKEGLYYLELN